jgi:hypothetical protein
MRIFNWISSLSKICINYVFLETIDLQLSAETKSFQPGIGLKFDTNEVSSIGKLHLSNSMSIHSEIFENDTMPLQFLSNLEVKFVNFELSDFAVFFS